MISKRLEKIASLIPNNSKDNDSYHSTQNNYQNDGTPTFFI